MPKTIFLTPEQAWTFARLPDVLDEHRIDPWVITHVGAHHGEEVAIYRRCGFRRIYLVEPDPRSVDVLRHTFDADRDVTIVAAACVPEHVPEQEPVTLYYAERSVWSGLHPHPSADGRTVQVPSLTLTDLLDECAPTTNVLVLDTQGSELDLLRTVDLDLDLVVIETSRRPGDTAAPYADTLAHMHRHGWTLVEEWIHDASGYTDCVYIADPEHTS